jgi:hypothetical protein
MIILAKDRVVEPLYAVVPLFNPWRWKSRWKHTERAIKHFMDSGVVVVLVEAAFNRRELVFADSGLDGTPANCGVLGTDHNFRHKYIGLHTKDELWLKENLIGIGVQHLPYDWQQVCWLDADVHFVRPNWVGECIHQLQHYAFLQMFTQAQDVGPNYELLPPDYPHASGEGIIKAWQEGYEFSSDGSYYGKMAEKQVWPGLAWACTRKAWDDVGGLIDFAVWGGADFHEAFALIERPDKMMRNDLHRNYQKMCMQWYHRCRTHIRQNVGSMDGVIFHHWHGRKTERGYNAKHALLAKIGFDPLRHLKRDSQGLWQLHDDRSTAFVQLRDVMRRIAHDRNEDDNDTRLDLWEQGH